MFNFDSQMEDQKDDDQGGDDSSLSKAQKAKVQMHLDSIKAICDDAGADAADVIDDLLGDDDDQDENGDDQENDQPDSGSDQGSDDADKGAKKALIIMALKKKSGAA